MKIRKFLTVILTAVLLVTMLPSMAFAAEELTDLSGQLTLQGIHGVGETLRAGYDKAEPEGLTDDDVTFQWSRMTQEDFDLMLQDPDEAADLELPELSTETSYTIREEDLGYHIVLVVTGRPEMGITGSLNVVSKPVVTAEEAAELLDEGVSSEETEELPEELEEASIEEAVFDTEEPAEESSYEEEDNQEDAAAEESYEYEDMESSDEPGLEEPSEEVSEETNEEEEIQWDDQEEEAEPIQVTIEEEYDSQAEAASGEAPAEEVLTEEQQQELLCEAAAQTEDESGIVDFGTISSDDTSVQIVTVTNTGNVALNFLGIAPEHFMVEDITETLEPGESVSLWIQPRDGLTAGSYEDLITYVSEEGAEASFTAKVVIEEAAAEELDETELQPADDDEQISEEDPLNEAAELPEDEEIVEEISEDPQEAEADGSLSADSNVEEAAFGTVFAGYNASDVLAQEIQITASSTYMENLSAEAQFENEDSPFEVSAVSVSDSEDGSQKIFSCTVSVKAGLSAGIYQDTLAVTVTDGVNEEEILPVQASVTVEEKTVSLTAAPTELAFGTVSAGYTELPAAQTVTVTNSGNQQVVLVQPQNDYFQISEVDGTVLDPGESATFTVQPVSGLAEGIYSQEISIQIQADEGETRAASFTASVTVAEKENTSAVLQSVTNPSAITGLANGTAKDVSSLKLPSTVVISTSKGEMNASVAWDVSSAAYDPTSAKAQNFTVSGSITLPDGVVNSNNLSLSVSVNVSVAAYSGKIADPAQNQITGISGTYTTASRISFTAVGAGMDNDNPKSGDTRYVPKSWSVVNSYSWDKAPYTASFGMAKAGTYTLSVVFNQQKYNGTSWADTGVSDKRSVSFTVTQSDVTPTSVPGQSLTPAAQKNAVNTGDDTPIAALVLLLAAAVAVIVGIVVYRNKKK
jgi:hypothetical protein